MYVNKMSVALVAALLIGGPAVSAPATDKRAPKPALKTPDKPSETDRRTNVKPGKPEFDQPPPDAIGASTPIGKASQREPAAKTTADPKK